ncbi:hypothetical protein [Labrys sp. WJW]|uniref:hypothetical protein n=1 Tax=Labrys sp. WJW TaxID=1737983 RepID=UPI0012EA770C|nr:hypothetical protein [Labrys sp. WJW]
MNKSIEVQLKYSKPIHHPVVKADDTALDCARRSWRFSVLVAGLKSLSWDKRMETTSH